MAYKSHHQPLCQLIIQLMMKALKPKHFVKVQLFHDPQSSHVLVAKQHALAGNKMEVNAW